MKTVNDSKAEIMTTLNHIRTVYNKLHAQSGLHRPFTFPDAHKLTEGLLLSTWTHWEEFIQEILIIDLATTNDGFLKKDIKKFRTIGAPMRYAEKILNHPDSPEKFIEWDYSVVQKRANNYLAAGHRYPTSLARQNDIDKLKRIRNGIAHKSDKAWDSFIKLVRAAPFSLTGTQLRGMTVGRFAFSHQWNGNFVLIESINVIEECVNELVP
ncbi:hypothetical protein [Phnomibacter ginsenosidimutans]|uniref:RiboL-PSP-HEPN domain-containing protein n=1 Tax=Phnomibacter ginsenosidimutans TaxID=2676868 RepID=A0A6I6G3Z2_9BACT|nr:hypothetical protein [Phnomibacter ginsenosidimutans]QGW26707.1 hypothetical protein GLV81_00035 [Phnomibacter ginsenosidimutans]